MHAAVDVADGVLSHLIAKDLSKEGSRLGKIAVGVIRPMPSHETSDSVGTEPCLLIESELVASVGAE